MVEELNETQAMERIVPNNKQLVERRLLNSNISRIMSESEEACVRGMQDLHDQQGTL